MDFFLYTTTLTKYVLLNARLPDEVNTVWVIIFFKCNATILKKLEVTFNFLFNDTEVCISVRWPSLTPEAEAQMQFLIVCKSSPIQYFLF